MKTNQNTKLNFAFENDAEELSNEDLMMIVGGESQSADPEAEEEKQQEKEKKAKNK